MRTPFFASSNLSISILAWGSFEGSMLVCVDIGNILLAYWQPRYFIGILAVLLYRGGGVLGGSTYKGEKNKVKKLKGALSNPIPLVIRSSEQF